jgi:hypothetical protein
MYVHQNITQDTKRKLAAMLGDVPQRRGMRCD